MIPVLLKLAGGAAALAVCALAAAIVWGGPGTPAPLASVATPFEDVDFSDLPTTLRYTARDGAQLAVRRYAPPTGGARGDLVLIHGSSGFGASVHPLARGLAAAGWRVHVPDMRGHGESGTAGRIAYIGQLEDDLDDLSATLPGSGRKVLAGFSAGGGFVLRCAGDRFATRFDDFVLLAPFVGQDSPIYRERSGGWVSVGLPRIVGLMALDRLGLRAFQDLPVVRYAVPPEALARGVTPAYGFALSMNFRAHHDWRADVRGLQRPTRVIVGRDDDQFFADRYAEVFAPAPHARVTIVDGAGHVSLTTTPVGIAAVVAALDGAR